MMKNIIENGIEIPQEKRIVFLGDSITDNGAYIAHMNAYFYRYMPEKKMNFINLGLSSETVSGLSEPDHPFSRPCVHERLERALSLSKPDWVVVCYGMNDGIYYPFSEERFESYKNGMVALIKKIKAFGAKAIILTPPPFNKAVINSSSLRPDGMPKYSYKEPFEKYDNVLKRYGEWISEELQGADKIINLYPHIIRNIALNSSSNQLYNKGDGIHPNILGHWIIAKVLLKGLFNISLEQIPEYMTNPESAYLFETVVKRHKLISTAWKEAVGHTMPDRAITLPLEDALKEAAAIEKKILEDFREINIAHPNKLSVWKGYTRKDFYFDGREGIIIEPKVSATGNPWIWRTEFFDAFSYTDMAMLENGWHLAYYRISDMYGCPKAIEMMKKFQEFVIKDYRLASRSVLLGFSRGGLYAFNYAAEYPSNVAALYLDAPVLDICSWPRGKGASRGVTVEWKECLTAYGLDEETLGNFKGNPLDRVEVVAKSKIPVIIVAGDSDMNVPFSENSAILAECFEKLGGKIKLIVKPGIGHHPHSLENPKEIVEFILESFIEHTSDIIIK